MPQKVVTTNSKNFFFFKKSNYRLISIDYGKRKLGFALTNNELSMALPLNIKQCKQIKDLEKSFIEKIEIIKKYIKEYKIWGIIIGLPLNMDGTDSKSSEEVRKFSNLLLLELELPILLQDERLTSMAADSLLKDAGFSRKERNEKDDMVAAQLIAESALEQMKRNL